MLYLQVRLLNGGAFEGATERVEVHSHSANWNSHFNFSCRITVDPSTGVLEKCMCRISLRKVDTSLNIFSFFAYALLSLIPFCDIFRCF